MGSKYYITESQMKKLVSHISNGGDTNNVLEEGVKEWVTALSLLASIAGVKAQTQQPTKDDIRKAEIIQDRLDTGDLDGDGVKDLKQYFTQAEIELNRDNLNKIKQVSDKQLQDYKTYSLSSTKAKLDQGYAIKEVEITRDTVFKKPVVVYVESVDSLSLELGSNQDFKSGSFDLTEESINIINSFFNSLDDETRITKVKIESSTDKEPISIGNDVLSQKRAESVKSVLSNFIDDSIVSIESLPEQGDEDWESLVERLGLEGARKHTEKYRYVKVTFEVVKEVPVYVPEGEKVIETINTKFKFELIKTKEKRGIIKRRDGGSSDTPKIGKCIKIRTKKGKPIPCILSY